MTKAEPSSYITVLTYLSEKRNWINEYSISLI